MAKDVKYIKLLIIALAIVFIVPQVALAAWWNPFSWHWGWLNSIFHFQRNQNENVACTMEAKQCPDGSYVGRVPPNCEFKPCPETKLVGDVYPLFSNLEWSNSVAKTMDVLNEGKVSGYEITTTTEINKNGDAYEFFNYYDKKLKAAGWTEDINVAADGILGGQRGYKKDTNRIVLNLKITPGKVISGTNEPLQWTCPCPVNYTVFSGTLANQGQGSAEQKCVAVGGKVSVQACYCSGTQDFYNNCAIGACTCTPNPQYKREIKNCDCGAGKCWNGTACVAQTY